jgi:LPXTG-motif cell wall-anchored protein
VADDELLPITGLGSAPWLAAGGAAIGIGALLMVLLGRRRKV